MFKDPFRSDCENNILVLCEAFIWADLTRPQKVFTERVPNFSNFRKFACHFFEQEAVKKE